MDLEPTGVSEEVIGSLKSCFVEGDAEQRRRENRVRRRALMLSIVLQSVIVAALVLFPLLGKSERITYEHTILPPYAPYAVRHDPGNLRPHGDNRRVCIVCFDPRNPPRPVKPGDRVDATLNEQEGDFVPGAPAGPGIPGGFGLSPSSRLPDPPRERPTEPVKRLRLASVEPAMLIHRVEPLYPTLARQLHREGRVELRAIIATDGSIQSLEVLYGDPLFIRSALEAVGQWRYRATILDGRPVEIDTRITVNYTLNR